MRTPSWTRAVVVGASSGIGEAIARQLGRMGCRVALVARREPELARLAEELRRAGTTARTYPHDVTAYEDVPALFQRIHRELEGLDLVVYSAGVMPAVAEDEY